MGLRVNPNSLFKIKIFALIHSISVLGLSPGVRYSFEVAANEGYGISEVTRVQASTSGMSK
jgi:hypothetical protein